MDYFRGVSAPISKLFSTSSSGLPKFLLRKYRSLWSVAAGNGEEPSVLDSRMLYDEDDNLVLVDKNGDYYDAYAMSWRFLGMYIDCGEGDDDNARQSGSGSGDGGDGGCYRAVMWAAYLDPKYAGGSIGEYQYYSASTGEWDDSTCMTDRCQKLDCHERDSHFQLLGVFKEYDGLEDFAEQLFKHHGYCLWGSDSDAYSLMYDYQDYWPTSCYKITIYGNNDYDTLYWQWQPLPGANMTYGLYEDDECSEWSNYTIAEYFYDYYSYYGYGSSYASSIISGYEERQASMNTYMDEYKVCQPCRAHVKYENYEGDNQDDGSGDHEDEGGGDAEQWGFNCYDYAGYRNVDQCYKFQTKTKMAAMSKTDLKEASSQGTILEIRVDGVVYGSGGFGTSTEWYIEPPSTAEVMFMLTMFSAVVVAVVLVVRKKCFASTAGSKIHPVVLNGEGDDGYGASASKSLTMCEDSGITRSGTLYRDSLSFIKKSLQNSIESINYLPRKSINMGNSPGEILRTSSRDAPYKLKKHMRQLEKALYKPPQDSITREQQLQHDPANDEPPKDLGLDDTVIKIVPWEWEARAAEDDPPENDGDKQFTEEMMPSGGDSEKTTIAEATRISKLRAELRKIKLGL